MTRKDEIAAQMKSLRDELWKIEKVEEKERVTPLLGKCYRYRNCYSCPEVESDYWWMYFRIVALEGGSPIAFVFENGKYGEIRIKPRSRESEHLIAKAEEIPYKDYSRAWELLIDGAVKSYVFSPEAK